jgi:hypothetical protein
MSRFDVISAWNRTDPDLESLEKETHIGFAMPDDAFWFHTDEPSIGKKVIAHPECQDIRLVVRDGDGRQSLDIEDYSDQPVLSVQASLPIGNLSIKSESRSDNLHGRIVSQRVLDEVRQ